jgi:ParB family chromosome partitioning protein
MARRKRIEAPDADALAKIDAEGAPARGGPRIPIAQVAGEAAALGSGLDAEREVERAEAETLRRLRRDGWEVRELPVAQIRTDAMTRDRMALDPEAMEELRASIRANGLRLPIEVSQRNPGEGYDLVSGLRRLTAVRDLMGPEATIRALVRPFGTGAAALGAMVEENEIRVNLTSYERGRTVALAVQEGLFPDIDAASATLFAAASKAKRSKVRSFARLHEELGDLLSFPQALSERQCLKLAAALKAGQGGALRRALETGQGTGPDEEWALLEAALRDAEAIAGPGRAEGRPARGRRRAPQTYDPSWIPLANDRFIYRQVDAKGHAIRFHGPHVDNELIEAVMLEIQRLLGEDG